MTGARSQASLGDTAGPDGERQIPFFCPYCGEEDLRPAGTQAGGWTCESCARGFQLRFTGVNPVITKPLNARELPRDHESRRPS
jgi:ribosomal protein L37AE/L43A